MRSYLYRLILVVIAAAVGLVLSGSSLADDAELSAENGYLLIRLKLSQRERVDALVMQELDTGNVVRMHSDSFEPAGLNAWMALVAVPKGRYFLTEYLPKYGMTGAELQSLPQRHILATSGTPDQSFEIVPGAVSYVGDWTIRVDALQRSQRRPVVEFDKATLERYVEKFPALSGRYMIYLSPLGEKAVSIADLAKNAE